MLNGERGKRRSREAEKQRNRKAEKQMTERFPRSGMTYDSMSSEGTAKAACAFRGLDVLSKHENLLFLTQTFGLCVLI